MSHLAIPSTPADTPKSETRSTSPSNFFGFNRSPKKDKPDHTTSPNRGENTSNLDRLLAGLNFSKFRITADRLGVIAATAVGNPSQDTASSSSVRVNDVDHLQRQNGSSPTTESTQSHPGVNGYGVGKFSAFMTRTVSQPAGLSVGTVFPHLPPPSSASSSSAVQLRRDRPRVTLSEDRINISSCNAGGVAASSAACRASSEKVSDDIASLITDVSSTLPSFLPPFLPPFLPSSPSSVFLPSFCFFSENYYREKNIWWGMVITGVISRFHRSVNSSSWHGCCRSRCRRAMRGSRAWPRRRLSLTRLKMSMKVCRLCGSCQGKPSWCWYYSVNMMQFHGLMLDIVCLEDMKNTDKSVFFTQWNRKDKKEEK